MATFPSYARIIGEGFSEKPDYGVLRTPMDGGIAKQRPTQTKPVVTRNVTIMVRNKEDKASFDSWVETDIRAAGWFTWINPITGAEKQARIVGGEYEWGEPSGPIWRARCKIESIG